MPNALATLALAVWPLVTVFLFLKLPPGRAVIATLLIDTCSCLNRLRVRLSTDSVLTKHTIPALSALLMWVWLYFHKHMNLDAQIAGQRLPLVAVRVLTRRNHGPEPVPDLLG